MVETVWQWVGFDQCLVSTGRAYYVLFIIYDTHFWGWSRVTPLYTKKRKEKKASTETKKKG